MSTAVPATDLSFAGSAKPRNRQFDLAQCCAHSRRLVSIMLEKSHELARLNQRIATSSDAPGATQPPKAIAMLNAPAIASKEPVTWNAT